METLLDVGRRRTGVVMPSLLVILVAVVVGLFVGRRVEGAHDAHVRFTSYRSRTMGSLRAWCKATIVTGLEVGGVLLAAYLLYTARSG